MSVTGEKMQEGDVFVLAPPPVPETPAITEAQSGAGAAPATTASAAAVNEDSHLSHSKLAEIFGLPMDALRTRLNRWRAKNDTGWIENPDRKPREAKYLYRVGSVRPVIDALRATS